MRVLLLGPYPPPHGGVQTNLVAIRDRLEERGHWTAVINLHRHRTGRGENVYHPRNAVETLRLLWRLRCDIVHLHLGGDLTRRLLALALVCADLPHSRSVLTFHSGGYARSAAGVGARPHSLRGVVFRRFDRIVAVNREIFDLFRRFGVGKAKLQLIPPHPIPQRPAEDLPPVLREFYSRHAPVLVTVGLLEPEYDLQLQIDALEDVRRRFPCAGLAILGAGSLAGELRRRAGEHVLLAGDIPHGATLRAIAEASVFLRTTRYDGDSVAVREALRLGTPVIATDNGMRPAGLTLIPASDRTALCESIGQIAGLPKPPPAPEEPDHIAAILDLYQELLCQ